MPQFWTTQEAIYVSLTRVRLEYNKRTQLCAKRIALLQISSLLVLKKDLRYIHQIAFGTRIDTHGRIALQISRYV